LGDARRRSDDALKHFLRAVSLLIGSVPRPIFLFLRMTLSKSLQFAWDHAAAKLAPRKWGSHGVPQKMRRDEEPTPLPIRFHPVGKGFRIESLPFLKGKSLSGDSDDGP
jgi:hypothetical protein